MGSAVRYGEVSPSHRERFEAGAFALDDGRTRWLDVGHDPERVIAHTDGGGLELRNGPHALEISATLPRIPAADRALQAVNDGTLRGVLYRVSRQGRAPGIRNPNCRAGGPGGRRPGGQPQLSEQQGRGQGQGRTGVYPVRQKARLRVPEGHV